MYFQWQNENLPVKFFVISSLSDFFLDDDGNDDDDDDVDDDITTQIWTLYRQILISRHFLVQSMNGERSREVPTTFGWIFFLSVCLSDVAKRNIFRNNCCQCCQITVTESSLALLTKIKRTIRVEIKNVENFLNQLVETKSSWDPLGPIFFFKNFLKNFFRGNFFTLPWLEGSNKWWIVCDAYTFRVPQQLPPRFLKGHFDQSCEVLCLI